MWPPVPPPAISRRMDVSLVAARAGLEGLPRDRQQDPDGGEAHDERRTAGADERQRDAGDRQQRYDDADVDEGLQTEPGRDARGEQRAERVRRPERGPCPGDREDPEERDDDERADEPEFLAD